ncbi:chromate resistance protein ChrB domain-containing protein [Roseomonas sp. CAU 1739]|uniref:chromate resistance protein ChrB domain-containing protein n=1 Tax=Roseomonas sp. CAU 1739 TaxID=3140364 RepID=UPI00325BFDD6
MSRTADRSTSTDEAPAEAESSARWLLLVFQLPSKPAYLRVKIWRRLQVLGAVAVKNAVYALPAGEQAQEDLEWLLKEISEGGGDAMIWEARLVDGLSDDDVRSLFNAARGEDYDAAAKEARTLSEAARSQVEPADARARLVRLRAEVARIASIDFFGANGREAVEGLMSGLEKELQEETAMSDERPEQAADGRTAETLTGKVWVTRRDVYVDRIASAWLIRRFIDPAARFKFVPAKGYSPQPGELRFDMYEGEFTHEGDRCTFEVLLGRADLERDGALAAVAEIVHDIDLKDGKFGRPEADGVRTLIAGLCAATADDEERLARGFSILDDLYRFFAKPARGRQ